jgi:NAD dependent epimerase/dehydratase family enzyme
MNVLVSGATGLIGSTLVSELEEGGHRVVRLTRSPRSGEDVGWDPDAGTIEGNLEGIEAVVHLAGESIAEGRWT